MTSDNIDAGSAVTGKCESSYCKSKSDKLESQQPHDTTSFSFPFLEGSGGPRLRLGELATAPMLVNDASRLVPLSPVGEDALRQSEMEGLLRTEEFACTNGFVGIVCDCDWLSKCV